MLVSIVFSLPVFAQPRLSAVLGTETDLLQVIPANENLTYRSDQFVQSTKQRRQFEGTTETTRQQNLLRQVSTNPYSVTTLSMNSSVRFGNVESRFKEPETIKRLGYDQIVTGFNGREVLSRKLDNNREVSSHRWQAETNSVDGDTIVILLRTLSSRANVQSFKAQVFTKWDGGNYEMEFIRNRLKNILDQQRQIPFPSQMRSLLQRNPEAIIWSMGLTGPAALFFPHKFYFVFEDVAPFRFLATWGGPPEGASFTWLVAP